MANPTAVEDAARTLLAWEDIDEDEDSKKRLEETQVRQLARSLAKAKGDFKETLWRAHRHLYLLGKDNRVKEMDLGNTTSSMAASLVELILNDLTRSEEVASEVGPNQLLKYWPPALSEWSTKAVRDAFYASPLLPRLLNPDSVRQTIAPAVTEGILGYARKGTDGRFVLERFRQRLGADEVEISDNVFLLRENDARKLVEPPRDARVGENPAG